MKNPIFKTVGGVCAFLIVTLQANAAPEHASQKAKQGLSDITVSVKGVGCPFCVYGLEKKLKEVKGVEDVQFNLKTGVAKLVLEEDVVPSLQHIPGAVKNAGFTMGEIHLTATGVLEKKQDDDFLTIRSADQTFILFEEKAEQKGKFLTDKTRRKLSKLEEEEASVSISGSIHFHPEKPPGLNITKVVHERSRSVTVKGMACEKCAERVSTIIRRTDSNVTAANVDCRTGQVQIESRQGWIETEKIRQAIEQAGFEASLAE